MLLAGGDNQMDWDFLQRYDESWIWRRVDRHDIMESTRNFAGLEECMEDAARHGYVRPGSSIARRSHTRARDGKRKT